MEADFHKAKLTDASLRRTYLNSTNFKWAKLTGADFGEARLKGTDFSNVDLRGVNNLELTLHMGRSDISISTIYLSRGEIPEGFLRGCGIPESFIVQIPALVAATQPIQFYSCFISYSSRDEDLAQRLHADLQNKGVRCWFAPEDLKIGDKFRDRIDESIRLHDKLLLILSENSVTSHWVGDEVEAAFERERRENRIVLFPIQIDGAVTESTAGWAAAIRRTRHIGDFTNRKSHDSYQKAFDRLLRDLKAEA
jgi:hypothetical protein